MVEVLLLATTIGVWLIFSVLHDLADKVELRFKDEEMEKMWLDTPKKRKTRSDKGKRRKK